MIATAGIAPSRIVRSLTRVADGVTTSDHLARRLGCDPTELAEPLAALANAGKVTVWAAPGGGLAVMLTKPNQRGPGEKLRRKARPTEEDVPLDERPDREHARPTPHDEHCYGMPDPGIILLGYRMHWPNPRWTRRSPCPGCGGQPLSVDTYCLVCDRWGCDGGTWGRRKGPEATRTRLPERNGLKGGKG